LLGDQRAPPRCGSAKSQSPPASGIPPLLPPLEPPELPPLEPPLLPPELPPLEPPLEPPLLPPELPPLEPPLLPPELPPLDPPLLLELPPSFVPPLPLPLPPPLPEPELLPLPSAPLLLPAAASAIVAPASSVFWMGVRSLEQMRCPLACGTQSRLAAQSLGCSQGAPWPPMGAGELQANASATVATTAPVERNSPAVRVTS
jgi:hypothetical protein